MVYSPRVAFCSIDCASSSRDVLPHVEHHPCSDFSNAFSTSSIAAAAVDTCASFAAIDIFLDGCDNTNKLDVQLGVPWQGAVNHFVFVTVVSELLHIGFVFYDRKEEEEEEEEEEELIVEGSEPSTFNRADIAQPANSIG